MQNSFKEPKIKYLFNFTLKSHLVDMCQIRMTSSAYYSISTRWQYFLPECACVCIVPNYLDVTLCVEITGSHTLFAIVHRCKQNQSNN